MASSLLMPDTASLTLSSMYWLNWELMPGMAARFRAMASARASRLEAVFHSERGLRFTLNSQTSKPLMSVPSSGRPSWLSTFSVSGNEARRWRTLWTILAASEGEMDLGMKMRTQRAPSSSLGRNSEPRKQ